MHALVTGGGGFLGRYIVEQLLQRGDRVRSFSRSGYPELEAQGVEVVAGDLRDPAAVARACEEIDVVFHAAAVPGVWGPWRMYYAINTFGTENVIAACQRAGVRKLVYTSSPSVVYDGRPHENEDESLPYPDRYLCHYPKSKAMAEQAVLAAHGREGLATVALRPHLIWGPRDNHLIPRLIARARSGRLRRVGNGQNLISMSYVENAAVAHLQAGDALSHSSACGGKAYFINEPAPVNLWNWVDEILQRAGLPPVRRSVSAPLAWRVGAALEAVYTLCRLRSEPAMTRFVAAQLSQSHYYRVDAAIRDFGYRPLVDYDEAIRRLEPDLHRLTSGPGSLPRPA